MSPWLIALYWLLSVVFVGWYAWIFAEHRGWTRGFREGASIWRAHSDDIRAIYQRQP